MLGTGSVRDVQQEGTLTSPEPAYGLEKKHVHTWTSQKELSKGDTQMVPFNWEKLASTISKCDDVATQVHAI